MAIVFRDKDDIQQLPPIPHAFTNEFDNLVAHVINDASLTLFKKLESLYDFLDRYNAFVSTFSVCQKGCADCCQIGVTMSRLEAEYITKNGGPILDYGSTSTAGKLNRDSCRFLSNDKTCSIYSSRPFNCRTFHTLDDPKYCKNKTDKHQVYGSANRGYEVTFYSELARWLYELHSSRNLPYRDIRDWFPLSTA